MFWRKSAKKTTAQDEYAIMVDEIKRFISCIDYHLIFNNPIENAEILSEFREYKIKLFAAGLVHLKNGSKNENISDSPFKVFIVSCRDFYLKFINTGLLRIDPFLDLKDEKLFLADSYVKINDISKEIGEMVQTDCSYWSHEFEHFDEDLGEHFGGEKIYYSCLTGIVLGQIEKRKHWYIVNEMEVWSSYDPDYVVTVLDNLRHLAKRLCKIN
jgi:hypothetical protein